MKSFGHTSGVVRVKIGFIALHGHTLNFICGVYVCVSVCLSVCMSVCMYVCVSV